MAKLLDTTPKKGAPEKGQSQKNKECIQTSIWLQYLFKKTDTKDTNQLVDKINNLVESNPSTRLSSWRKNGQLETNKTNFRGYRSHKTAKPRNSIVDAVELGISGSREVFENHSLTQAIITENVEDYFREILRKRKILFKDISSNSYNKITDRDLETVLNYSVNLLKEYKISNNFNHLFNSYELSLQLIGNLTILLRFLIKKSQYADTDWRIEDIAAILINIIETDDLKNHLKLPSQNKQESNSEIRCFYLKWLYETLKIQNIITEEQFLSDPKDYLRLKLEEVIEDHDDFGITALELANLIEKKSMVWLPNEDFIKGQLRKFKQSSIFNWRKLFVLKHASVEKSVPMKLFNQGIRLISIIALLFFSVFTMVFTAKTTFALAAFSLLCSMTSALLYTDVTKTIKRNIFT